MLRHMHSRSPSLLQIVGSFTYIAVNGGKFSNALLRNPGRDISFPIFIRKEIETRKLERKSKQKTSRLIDLLYRLNDIISR